MSLACQGGSDGAVPRRSAATLGAANGLALAATPTFVLNVTGREVLPVRQIAEWFGRRFGTPTTFVGGERPDALLSNTDRMHELFAPPEVNVEQMMEWVAAWIEEDRPLLGKPTHFEARDGRF